MKKYCFFMTGSSFWFDVAKSLKDQCIAEPVLWLGDDVHYAKARAEFGGEVVRMLDFVHRPYNLTDEAYSGTYHEFFLSESYIKAKDICLKMMDRLDLYGSFSRIDREAYFHMLCIWTLGKIEKLKPDALIMVERPHSHAQYIIYEICKFIGVEISYFVAWTNLPMACLFNETRQRFIVRKTEFPPKYKEKFRNKIDIFVSEMSLRASSSEAFEPVYMEQQKKNSQWWSRVKRFFGAGLYHFYLDVRHNVGVSLRRQYSPINPYRFGFLRRMSVKSIRSSNLRASCSSASEEIQLGKPYVYFPLHFEPERTTNPDGRQFHDHFSALVALRAMLPTGIDIVVKEHPSQFYYSEKGSRGRSPLFYQLIKKIDAVRFIGSDYNSVELINNSMFTATITGTVALESALMGKVGLYFGEAWYEGCPNTIRWDSKLDFEFIKNFYLKNVSEVAKYLNDKLEIFSVPLLHNPSADTIYPDYVHDDFVTVQAEQAASLIAVFFDDLGGQASRKL